MRNKTLLDNVDASVQNISDAVNLDKRTDWKIIIESDTLDGVPQLFIEEGFTGGKCSGEPTDWFALSNKCDDTGVFSIDTTPIMIERNYFTGNWIRVRVEANGNTTGNYTVKLHYKDYP